MLRPTFILRAALLTGAALLLLAPPARAATLDLSARPAPVYCAVTVIPDNLLIVAYRAVLRLDPACPPNGQARVRKVSTVNPAVQRPGGLPQFGGLWGWTLTQTGDDIPPGERWTSLNRAWNYWDGARWLPARRR